ncbi:hypothetical protein FNN89_12805 [Salmonella enterica subsp. salamae]|nr:hypothetical protein [Salmonella enterica subsp. salamae]
MKTSNLKLSQDVEVTLEDIGSVIEEKPFYEYTAVEDGERVEFSIFAVDETSQGTELLVKFPDGITYSSGGIEYIGGSWVSPALTTGESYTFIAENMLDVEQVIGIHMESIYPA